ncbi:Gfo/Idh/MocA family oxidoreductase [Microbacterium capsulatum]|uniref:Gfo/Idh/MocA family oxidoreductase n=1 Tax=Microbacterium capsulatum TaxID=3041921 RepID=A0ABU0XDA6_9MICO|nr:Gfo/Idh/MocA family oxidoreductase [Microbacterium sp. ASV81]MDQ4213098.1 Gfo/Idh/MocA family oxidoreductase [Microbacterium sp. ASV81]
MNGSIRVGVVGAGFFGAMIARACDEHGAFSVTAVADAVPEAAERLATALGARVHGGAEALAAADDVDLVVVATPNHLHADPAIAGLRAGKHVFVEKPLGIDADSIDAILAAAEDAPGRLVVGHVMRAFPGVRRMVAQARGGALGTLIEAAGARRRLVHVPADPGDWWKLDRSRSGGELLHEIHELDLVVWALGEPASVVGVVGVSGAPLAHGAHIVDSVTETVLRTADGALGRHSISTSAHRAEWWFRISGTDASVEADFRAGTVTRFVDGAVVDVTGVFDDDASNDSLREAAQAAQAYNTGGPGPLWMRTAVTCELDEIAAAVQGSSTVLTEHPATAARTALRANAVAAEGRQ